MSGNSPIGPGTPIDGVLNQFFEQRPEAWSYQLLEDETNALLAAILMEQAGLTSVSRDNPQNSEASYHSTEEPITVDSTDEDTHTWNFPARAVTVYGFDAPIHIAFKDGNKSNRVIPLDANQGWTTFSPPGGLGASQMWYRKADEQTSGTELKVLAFP